MARIWVASNSDYATVSSVPTLTPPFTIAATVLDFGSAVNPWAIVQFIDTTELRNKYHYLGTGKVTTEGAVAVSRFRGTTGKALTGASTWYTSQWMFVAGRWASTASRSVFCRRMRGSGILGSNLSTGTNSTSVTVSMSGNPITYVGALRTMGFGGGYTYSDGKIGYVAIWDDYLLTSQLVPLADGANPLEIQPRKRKVFWPLTGIHDPEIDLAGWSPLTLSGPDPYSGGPPVDTRIWHGRQPWQRSRRIVAEASGIPAGR